MGFDPSQGVGPDGATSLGIDPATGYPNGEPSWHQPAMADTDGDGISNHVENSIGTDPDDAGSTPVKIQLWNLQQQLRREALSAAQREDEAKLLKAEQERRALEAEHQAQRDHEEAHPEAVRQPDDVRVLDDENRVVEVSVQDGRPLVKVTRTNADGSTREAWTTPTDEELADHFVKNPETGAWEKRDYTERYNNQEKRLYTTALPATMKMAESSLDALLEVNITAATIVAGGAGVAGTAPKIIAMGKEALSEATGIPTGLKDIKDWIKSLFTKKAIQKSDDIADAANRTPWTQVSSDARAILRDVEGRTGMSIPYNQRSLLADQVRAVDHRIPVGDAQYRALQAEYRSSRSSMIADWQANTGQVWPTGAQAHHVIPTRYGGPNQWWNIHPAQSSVHQGGIHGVGSPTQSVFPTPVPR